MCRDVYRGLGIIGQREEHIVLEIDDRVAGNAEVEGYGNMSDYWYWLRAEYFVKHLLGDDQWNPDIVELQVERPKG